MSLRSERGTQQEDSMALGVKITRSWVFSAPLTPEPRESHARQGP